MESLVEILRKDFLQMLLEGSESRKSKRPKPEVKTMHRIQTQFAPGAQRLGRRMKLMSFRREQSMKTRVLIPLATLALLVSHQTLLAQASAFTYQGRLNDNGAPANGSFDLRFTIYDSASGDSVIDGPLTNASTSVNDGLFTVRLDFGADAFTGADRWLEIGVRTNGSAGAYQALSPRQQLTATPYATRAANFSGAVSDAQLSANIARLNGNQTFTGSVNFSSASNSYTGTFSGNGAGLAHLDLSLRSGGAIGSAGNFVLTSSPRVRDFPEQVAAADVNGDGAVDLIS